MISFIPINRSNGSKNFKTMIVLGTMAEESSPGVLEKHQGSLFLFTDTKEAIAKVKNVSI